MCKTVKCDSTPYFSLVFSCSNVVFKSLDAGLHLSVFRVKLETREPLDLLDLLERE